MENFLKISGIIFWSSIAIYLGLRLYLGKNWMIKLGTKTLFGQDLIVSLKKLIVEFQEKNVKSHTLAEVGAHIVWRVTRIGVFTVIVAFFPFILLFQQNIILQDQNKRIDAQIDLFEIQNERIHMQSQLMESERRSSLVFMMTSVLDKLDDELEKNNKISNGLERRIIALSRGFTPYKRMNVEKGILDSLLVSPERGQLLISISKSGIDSTSMGKITLQGDFSYSLVDLIDFSNQYFPNINLNQSSLIATNFNNSNLTDASICNAMLLYANFDHTILRKAVMSETNFEGTSFRGADLRGAIIFNGNFEENDFSEADLRGISFKDSHFGEVFNLEKSQLLEAFSLSGTTGLDSTLIKELKIEKPCLFSGGGCSENYIE